MDKSFATPLNEVALKAIEVMKSAMDEGAWDPAPESDPADLIANVEAAASSQPSVIDLSQARELAQIALSAMESGQWANVSGAQISIVQRFNFLSMLADEMAPTPAEVALAM